MAKFDCIADFEALTGPEALSSAETKLIEACKVGGEYIISQLRPKKKTKANTIRATLMRVLITGGTPECGLSVQGVCLYGAWITGTLDLMFKRGRGPTLLIACCFEKELILKKTEFSWLSLRQCKLPGLSAEGLVVEGVLNLSYLQATQTVNLMHSKIGVQLNCKNAEFSGGICNHKINNSAKWNPALNAQGIRVEGEILLNHMKAFGVINLGSADISGSLSCNDASFDGTGGRSFDAQGIDCRGVFFRNLTAIGQVGLKGAHIKGQFDATGVRMNGENDLALYAESLIVTDDFIWRQNNTRDIYGGISLSNSHVRHLVDDMESWPEDLKLEGFTYDRITASPISADERIPWLAKGSTIKGIFHPQPYTQLAKVLFAMGHDREAKKILMERENRLSMVALQNLRAKPNGGTYLMFENPLIDAQVCGAKAWFWTIGLLAGHGYAPFRALVAMLALIAVTTFLAYQAWSNGAFAPNSDVIVTSEAWQLAMMNDCVPAPFPGCDPNPALTWSNDRAQGIDWASFNALAYAADLALPVVELGQTSAWAPSKDRGVWGETLWWASWWIELLGWLFTVLGGAAITGLIQRSRE